MDVDCPAQSSNVGTTMRVGASEGYSDMTADACSMEVGDSQPAKDIPEVQMNVDHADDIGMDMEIDAEFVTSRGAGTITHVTSFRQAANNGWKWVR